MKIIGLVCLFFCICLLGFYAAENLKKRADALDKICQSITKYKALVSHSGKEIAYILPESFKGVSFVDFSEKKPKIKNTNLLKTQDKMLLETFLKEAGSSNKTGENNRSDYFFESFSRRKKEAQKAVHEKKKIYIVSGICSALAAVVVLI